MKINRSVKCHFNHLTGSKKKRLGDIQKEYTLVTNLFISLIEDQLESKTKFDLGKKEFLNQVDSWFSARMKQVAFQEAYGMVKGARELAKTRKDLKYYPPLHKGNKMMLSANIISVSDSKKMREFDMVVSLTSIGNKEKITIPLKKHRQFNKWDSLGKRASTVVIGKDYIQFSFEIETGSKKKLSDGDLIGIDSGVASLMTLSSGEFIGDKTRHLIDKLHRKKRNSKSYKKAKKEIKYYINKEVKQLPFESTSLFVVENLKNMKQKMKVKRRLTKNIRRVIHDWSYRQLLNRIQMSCEENRVSFRSVSPFRTSITCNQCNHADKTNRLSQDLFICQECGYTDNADHNASINILNRFVTGKYGSGYRAA